MNDNMTSKMIEGRDASNADLGIINNPYAAGSIESEAWLKGWFTKQAAWLGASPSLTTGIRIPAQPAIKAA